MRSLLFTIAALTSACSTNPSLDSPVGGPNGGPTQVRLGDVADVRIVAKPEVITHDQVSRSIDVVANVSGRSLVPLPPASRMAFMSIHHSMCF